MSMLLRRYHDNVDSSKGVTTTKTLEVNIGVAEKVAPMISETEVKVKVAEKPKKATRKK